MGDSESTFQKVVGFGQKVGGAGCVFVLISITVISAALFLWLLGSIAYIVFYPPPPIDKSSPLDQAVVSVNTFTERSWGFNTQGYKFVHNAEGNYRNLNVTASFYFYPHWQPSSNPDTPPKIEKKYIQKWDSKDELKFYISNERIQKITLFIEGDLTAGDNILKKIKFEQNWDYKRPFDKP